MINHIIDIGDQPASISCRNSLLCIRCENGQGAELPIKEVKVLVVSHPQTSFSAAVLSSLAESGGAFVVCDARRQPSGMLLPVAGHSTQTERMAVQAKVKLPVKKRLWRQLVKAKIIGQARVLERCRGKDFGLRDMAGKVRSGDAENMEARAARKYWPQVFGQAGETGFSRDAGGEGLNSWLNYGYAVLRAITARAICACGLHPSLGVHHHNRYDSFCLASDLMEPYRPLVDGCVVALCASHETRELTLDVKRDILVALAGRFRVDEEDRSLFGLTARTAQSLVEVYMKGRKDLYLPRLMYEPETA